LKFKDTSGGERQKEAKSLALLLRDSVNGSISFHSAPLRSHEESKARCVAKMPLGKDRRVQLPMQNRPLDFGLFLPRNNLTTWTSLPEAISKEA